MGLQGGHLPLARMKRGGRSQTTGMEKKREGVETAGSSHVYCVTKVQKRRNGKKKGNWVEEIIK